jgi:hypothetical protein
MAKLSDDAKSAGCVYEPWSGELLSAYLTRVLARAKYYGWSARVDYGGVLSIVKPTDTLEDAMVRYTVEARARLPEHLKKFILESPEARSPHASVSGPLVGRCGHGVELTRWCDGCYVHHARPTSDVRHALSTSPVAGCYCGVCRHDRNADRVRNAAGETEEERCERLAARARARAAEERPSLIAALPEGPRPKRGVAVMDEATLADLLCEEVEP